MNELYGIDPEIPSSLRDINQLTDLFGTHRGRFIASYPNDWILMIRQNLSNLPPLDKARAVTLLKKLENSTLPVEAEYRRIRKWVENTYNFQNSKNYLSKIYTSPNNPYKFSSLNDLLTGHEELPDSLGDLVPMTVNNYRKIIKPLFLKSTEVHVIDKYLQLRNGDEKTIKRRRNILRGLFEEARNSKRCNSFLFHIDVSKEKKERKNYDIILENYLEDTSEIAEDIGFSDLSIRVLPDTYQHARYIFGIQGGLKFDQGFETSRDPSQTMDIQWISPKILDGLLNKYGSGYL
jgi:hypothetical protein